MKWVFLMLLMLMAHESIAQNWIKYDTDTTENSDKDGNLLTQDHFYDKDSFTYPEKGHVLVWHKDQWVKITEPDGTEHRLNLKFMQFGEFDCKQRKYRTLSGKVESEGNKDASVSETQWIYFEPGDSREKLYNISCKIFSAPKR